MKDADATSIYGSMASKRRYINHYEKKVRQAEQKVDLNMQSGFGKVTQRIDVLNTQQYLDMRREAYF